VTISVKSVVLCPLIYIRLHWGQARFLTHPPQLAGNTTQWMRCLIWMPLQWSSNQLDTTTDATVHEFHMHLACIDVLGNNEYRGRSELKFYLRGSNIKNRWSDTIQLRLSSDEVHSTSYIFLFIDWSVIGLRLHSQERPKMITFIKKPSLLTIRKY